MKTTQKWMPFGIVIFMLATSMFSVRGYAQQEVDPTWYDPWGNVKPPVSHSLPEQRPASHKKDQAPSASSGTVRVKRTAQPQQHSPKPKAVAGTVGRSALAESSEAGLN